MPELTIKVGNREFVVACQEGEEAFLETAAAVLNAQATSLISQIGRMPESKMLLMSGLLLADRVAAAEDKMRMAETDLARLKSEITALKSAPAKTVPVPTVPQDVLENLAELSAQAEAVADNLEEKLDA